MVFTTMAKSHATACWALLIFGAPIRHVSAGSPFMWHRAWALQQEKSRDKQFTGVVYDTVVACEEEYCNFAKNNKCDLDCVVPEHGCTDYCYRNSAAYLRSNHPQAKYYICADKKIRGKERRPTCAANGFPVDRNQLDATSVTCCGWFGCNGGPRGGCNPSQIRIQCQKEAREGGNPKLVGCLKQVWNKMDRERRYPDNMNEFVTYKGGDMSVAVPWGAFRRRKYYKFYTSSTEGDLVDANGNNLITKKGIFSKFGGGPSPSPSPSPTPPGKCAASGEQCREAGCCERSNDKCIEQDASSAVCRKRCPRKDWTCKVLNKSPSPSPSPSPTPPGKCAASGEQCREARCCERSNDKCIERDASSAVCRKRCPGKDWTCKILSRAEVPPELRQDVADSTAGRVAVVAASSAGLAVLVGTVSVARSFCRSRAGHTPLAAWQTSAEGLGEELCSE